MNSAESKKRALPPYVSYTSFYNLINELKKSGIPSHVDRSILNRMSGSAQAAMLATLKSLKLTTLEGEPTENFRSLINASEENFSKILHGIVKSTYDFLFSNSIDLETTTTKKVEEKFREIGASGSTLSRCIAFFLAAAKVANIPVSRYVKPPKIERSLKTKDKVYSEKSQNQENEYHTISEEENLFESSDMVKITIPLRDTLDGLILFPKNMDEKQIRQAVKMADFILKNYYEIKDEK
jgi:Family of unknown function (DUF5343)